MTKQSKRVGRYNKAILKAHNKRAYEAWVSSDEMTLSLPAVAGSPFVKFSSREDIYKKTIVHGWQVTASVDLSKSYVSFIQKNDKPHSFTWTTSAAKLREGVRWGIIPVESITGKVIGALGRYRVVEHERVVKGLISNTHRAKLALLDHYQDRFEALQALESLVNQNNIDTLQVEFKRAFQGYIARLKEIKKKVGDQTHLSADVVLRLQQDIDEDMVNARVYYHQVFVANKNKDHDALKSFNRARGNDSILEFVKQQMTYSLYEMQGINQDMTYRTDKTFALTRGVLNDCIEDARKVLDDHRADPRNLVLPEHHGHFGEAEQKHLYDFKKDHLDPEREREVLLAVSFIEGWDKVVYDEQDKPQLFVESRRPMLNVDELMKEWDEQHKPSVYDPVDSARSQALKLKARSEEENQLKGFYAQQLANSFRPLVETAATNWRSSVSFTVFIKKASWIVVNALLSFIGRTQTLDENPWQEKDEKGKYTFKAFATELRRSPYVRTYEATDPLYIKAIKLIIPTREKIRDKTLPWYKKIQLTLLGSGIYRSTDSFPIKIKKIVGRFIEVFSTESVAYRGARPNESLWLKLGGFLKLFFNAGKNIYFGVKDFFQHLLIDLWRVDIYYDYKAGKVGQINSHLEQELKEKVDAQLGDIQKDFDAYLNEIDQFLGEKHKGNPDRFQPYSLTYKRLNGHSSEVSHAHMPYRLTPGDDNGIVKAMVEGVTGFASFFTHSFAKDPLGAVAFGTAYSFVGGSIMLPKLFSFMGPSFAAWAKELGLSMASGGASSAVASAALVGQWGWGVVDIIEHGPQSGAVKTISMVLDNPLSLGAGIGAAWLAGHVLTLTIPVLSHDLGTNEDIGKLTYGAKGAALLHHAFESAQKNLGKPIRFTVEGIAGELNLIKMTPAQQVQNERFKFVAWLAERQEMLPRLTEGLKRRLVQLIDQKFKNDPNQAAALKQLVYPVRLHSIAYELVNIPLSYIPAVIRLVCSLFSSAITASTAPMAIAGAALGKKIVKDVSRLISAGESLLHLVGNVASIAIKIPVYLLTMAAGRVTALFGVSIGHALHRLFAPCHVFLRRLGEALFPETIMKHVVDEHPRSLLEREQNQQKKLFAALGIQPGDNAVVESVDSEKNEVILMDAPAATSSAPAPSASQSTQLGYLRR